MGHSWLGDIWVRAREDAGEDAVLRTRLQSCVLLSQGPSSAPQPALPNRLAFHLWEVGDVYK